MATKNWTRPDNVFGSSSLEDKLIFCTTDPRLRGPGTDHVPILTVLELPVSKVNNAPALNWHLVDWDVFKEELATRLEDLPAPAALLSETEFHEAACGLTAALQDTMRKMVPEVQPSPHSKCWWSKSLSALRKRKNKLSATSFKFRASLDHPSHIEHRDIRRVYSKEIFAAKQVHWSAFLEGLSYTDVWTANRYISSDTGDGGKTRVPTLFQPIQGGAAGSGLSATSNEEKSKMLVQAFFPSRPETSSTPAQATYDGQIPAQGDISEDQLRQHLANLKPYKAPGPYEIPNLALKNCAELLTPYLF